MKIDINPLKTVMNIDSDEMFLTDPDTSCYRRLEFINEILDIGVDVGAHIGVMSIAMALRGFKKVYAFEPIKSNYDKLYNNILGCEYQSIIYPHRKAVWNKTGDELQFKRAGNTGQHSALYYQHHHQFSDFCQTISFVDMCKMIDQPIDYLKIDTEGAEYWIITPEKEVVKCLEEVKYIDIDLHEMDCKEFFDLKAFVKNNKYYPSAESAPGDLILLLMDIGFVPLLTDDTKGYLLRNNKRYPLVLT